MTPEPPHPGPPNPPPPGTFRIDRDGVWRHEGAEVTHPGVIQNLYANLRVEEGAHFLQVGPARIPVAVDDAPFVVTRLEIGADPGGSGEDFRIYLSDGSVENLAPGSLWVGPRSVPYCRVKAGRFTARLSVAAWLQLAPRVEEGPAPGETAFVVGGRRIPLAPPPP